MMQQEVICDECYRTCDNGFYILNVRYRYAATGAVDYKFNEAHLCCADCLRSYANEMGWEL